MTNVMFDVLNKQDFIQEAQKFSDELYYNHIDIVLVFQTKNLPDSVIEQFVIACEKINSVVFIGNTNQTYFMLYLCVPIGKEHHTHTIHQTIKSLFAQIKLRDKQAYRLITTSRIGISVIGEDCSSMQQAITHAFQAMMEQQSNTKQRIHFFDSKLQLAIKRQLLLEEVVKVAIDNDEVNVVYQPIVNCQTWSIDGYEVLSRFQCDPILKATTRELIEIAEDINLISELDLLTYHKALLEMKSDIKSSSFFLNINISANTRQNFSELFECIRVLNKQNQFDHSRLVMDIIPSRDSWEKGIQHIQVLIEQGSRIALSDLSPGFDLGAKLVQGNFDFLRLDDRFYAKFHDETEYYQVVKLLVKLCHDLNVKLIVEGVSSIEQARVLMYLGVDYLQGNVFTLPVKIADIAKLPKAIGKVVEQLFNDNESESDRSGKPLMSSVGSIASHSLPRLTPGDPISLVSEYFKTQSVTVLPVIAEKRCVGTVDRALLNLHLTPTMGTDLETEKEARIWHRPVNSLMNVELHSVEATLDAQSLLKLIKEKNYQLPLVITKQGYYSALLTERDLIDYLLNKVN